MFACVLPRPPLEPLEMTIDEFTKGRIYQHRLGLRGRGPKSTDASSAAHFGVSRAVVKNVRLRGETPKEKAKKAPTTAARQRTERRKLIRKLAKQTKTKGNAKWCAFPSAQAISDQLRTNGVKISARTVTRDLREMGFKSYVRRYVPTRDKAVHKKRLLFSKGVLSKGPKFMKRIVHSDEFPGSANDYSERRQWSPNRIQVHTRERKRRQNAAYCDVWAAIGHNYKSQLVLFPCKQKDLETGTPVAFRLNAKKYVRQCLSKVAPELSRRKAVFMHDGARAHTAKSVQKYLASKKIELLLDWPAYSPDLNPIEQVWSVLKLRTAQRHPQDLDELLVAIKAAWESISQKEINKFCASFSTKLKRCVENGGAC